MTKVQTLMLEINKLDQNELELIQREILRRVDRRKRAEAALNKLVGSGMGVWGLAQQYLNAFREDDRL
ncbi:MAG: hypothetical protein H6563_01220 [Lewinellaceae bacterium]|nr:hypothetical protein [Lewinellaceae bacterium]